MRRIVLLMLIILAISGCKKDGQKLLTGKVTFSFVPDAGDYYIILDDDKDLSNGYVARLIESSTGAVGYIDYVILTDNIPEGSYYIRGGYDSESTDNMNPSDPTVWEGQGWYGSNNTAGPASANVTNLTGNYDFVVYPQAE